MNNNIESLVMRTSHSLKINEVYQQEVLKMEEFIKTVESRPNLTDSEKECVIQSKAKIEELKRIVENHKNQIRKHLEENNLEIVYNVAEVFNGFIK